MNENPGSISVMSDVTNKRDFQRIAKPATNASRGRIIVVGFGGRPTGGSAYEDMVPECLAGDFEVDSHQLRLGGRGVLKYLALPTEYLKLNRALAHGNHTLAIKTLTAAIFAPKDQIRSIVIFHHADVIAGSIGKRIAERIMQNLHRADAVVTVAEYWNEYLRKRGVTNVYTIPNAFRLGDFALDQDETAAFQKRYGLLGKPVIYLGALGPGKGVEQAFDALKDLDVHLVASGRATAPTPSLRCMHLDRRDYLRLLAASDIAVTMSQFEEGWCRAAHEAMLCETPVVGSGKGGMRELLEPGGQIIAHNFDEMRAAVKDLLADEENRAERGRAGYEFARQFTYERFRSNWIEVVREMHR